MGSYFGCVITLVGLVGCAHGSRFRGPSDAVAIAEATPESGTVLRRGQVVSLSVTATYTLSSSADGEVVLVVFVPNTGRNLVEPQPATSVPRGDGQVTLATAFTVPHDTERVGLSVILAGDPKDKRTAKSKPAAQQIVFYAVR
jgi:hypothetical protein